MTPLTLERACAVTDSTDRHTARGIPILFRAHRSVGTGATVQNGMPGQGEIIAPV